MPSVPLLMISTPPHHCVDSFSITARPIPLKLSQYTLGTWIQNVSKFDGVWTRIGEVHFSLSISTPPDHQYPYWCVYRFDLAFHWAKSFATSGLESQYMPADGIKVWRCSDHNCRSWFLTSPCHQYPSWWSVPLLMRFLLRSHDPLGHFARHFRVKVLVCARKFY
jgi:hypothetical protein